jgi:hypothetical protein
MERRFTLSMNPAVFSPSSLFAFSSALWQRLTTLTLRQHNARNTQVPLPKQ